MRVCACVRMCARVCVCVCEVFCPFLELDIHVPSIALTNILHNNNDSFLHFGLTVSLRLSNSRQTVILSHHCCALERHLTSGCSRGNEAVIRLMSLYGDIAVNFQKQFTPALII